MVPKPSAIIVSHEADAVVGDVLSPKTFYSVAPSRVAGTMPTVAIVAADDTYAAGYHAGDAGGLDAIDLDLATANIKSGITVFGKAGAATVQDIADADLTVAEAPTGKKFYAVTGGVKTGTGTKTLNPANDTVAAGYYAATTLSAVDTDLAVANIKTGVTVFGKAGTYLAYAYTVGDLDLKLNAGADTTSTTYVLVTTLLTILNTIFATTLRIYFLLQSADTNAVYGKIYRNITAVGTERSTTSTWSGSEDITGWSLNDIIKVYGKMTTTDLCRIRNVTLRGTAQLFTP